MKYKDVKREEELKNKVAHDYFDMYDCTKIIGNVDFCVILRQSVKELFEQESLLWAEAKKGSSDIYRSMVQLILTIGKARTFDNHLPPALLGAFDAEKIAFIPYATIHEVFYLNDFNWNVTPSNYDTKEFKLIHEKVQTVIDSNALLFNFHNDDNELKTFIKNNFIVGKFDLTKTKIDKNNFMIIYNKWLQTVKPTIAVNWDIAKKTGIIDGDFYLADLLSHENKTLKEKLFVLLKHDHYEIDHKLDEAGMFSSKRTNFYDKQVAHTQFWNKYDRPPKEEYWDYIVERRDLLVPQDIRERKGSFFTPQIWVELSQKYLTDVLGENWQDEYTVWDCAAGTGNLLTGLTNKYNIWASTLDKQDVEVMHDRIKNGACLLDDHVFQFDFLNDDFSKLPKPLQDIINNPEKRKKLVVYINPPYAEVSSVGLKGKVGVNKSKTHEKYSEKIGTAGREVYAMFLIRIYDEIKGCIIGEFSTFKVIQGSAFSKFRDCFKAELVTSFAVPAATFDNVNGTKTFTVTQKDDFINQWISQYKGTKDFIGFLAGTNGNSFQHNKIVYILNKKEQMPNPRGVWISSENIIKVSIYLSVRQCIEATWLNDRDQFLFPYDLWVSDAEFQNDCLAFTLFHGQNRISSTEGTNHWIPFTEEEVNAKEKFESDFMSKFIKGKDTQRQMKMEENTEFDVQTVRTVPLVFSPEAVAVFEAGCELWKYYHSKPNCNVNASLYDIREHFQGRNEAGKMNSTSADTTYTELIGNLRAALKQLAKKIEPKVYEYGFLRA
ncbi:hypothetical protein CHS0354_000792 [Potamilus streckersoni]|uniref:Uncharacterized protein n=1 Tax=Potamilus streckersoni TaxID=2493646 RepID=A0AAE0T8G4_9BIVA|nr:hypothetical protein CHS0354_000792 [Potamilus streckersoni]